MERSEPSLVPEWLRHTGGGTGGGNSTHNVASSQADGPLLALPRRNRISKSIINSDASHSSFLDRSSSTNSRRSSSSNGSSKHDKNSYSRSYSSSSRNQHNKDRERLGIADTWDSEYSDPLTSIIAGRIQKDNPRRSQSMLPRRLNEFSLGRVSTDLRNSSHNTNGNGSGAISDAGGSTGIHQKVSFERDFPVLGSDERPTTPDVPRVPSPAALSRGLQGLSIGTSSLMGSEGWTSALAEVPTGAGSNNASPSASLRPPSPAPAPAPAPATAQSSSASTYTAAGVSNNLKLAEALAQAPAQSQNSQQQPVQTKRSEELPFMGSKRLIPMTTSVTKTSVLNPSDKLKPKAAMRLNEAVSGLKNGLQQTSSLQLGSQQVRGGGARADGPKSSSTKKLFVLKPMRENGVCPSQIANAPGVVVNGQLTGAPPVVSVPIKNQNNVKQVDKQLSLAQLQSRNDFFNLVRRKSMRNTSAAADSGTVVSTGVHHSDEQKDMASGPVTPTENGSEMTYNGDKCNLVQDDSNCEESDSSDNAIIHPIEEEEAFLRSLGWEDSVGDEGGLTEEEIKDFVEKVKKMTESDHLKSRLVSRLCRGCS